MGFVARVCQPSTLRMLICPDASRKFGAIDPDVPHRHHDAIEFPDGSNVLVTQLAEGQRVTVLQLPVVHQVTEHAHAEASTDTPLAVGWMHARTAG